MPVETTLDEAVSTLLSKAVSYNVTYSTAPGAPAAAASSYTIPFFWSGGSSALSAAAAGPLLIEVPDPGEIVWVHLYAGDVNGAPVAVTTVLDLQITRWETFGGSSPVYGSGTSPRITADSLANMSLSGWYVHFDSGDTLIARINSFSGSATWVAMVIRVRRDASAQAQSFVTDAGGAQVLDAFGNPIIFRS